jgi:hypothetical protein
VASAIRNLSTATLVSLTNNANFIANNASTTTLMGSIENIGGLRINSTGSFTDLSMSGNVTLTGAGTVSLTNAARVRGSGILTNANNTISRRHEQLGQPRHERDRDRESGCWGDRSERLRVDPEYRPERRQWARKRRRHAREQRRHSPVEGQWRRKLHEQRPDQFREWWSAAI